MRNRVKQLLRDGRTAIGTFAYLCDPAVVEIAGIAGFDFIIIDMEHSPCEMGVATSMVRAADAVGLSALIRVRTNDEKEILRALESGAAGVVVPMVDSAEDAKRAVNAALYPPGGQRGLCPSTRASGYGFRQQDFGDYMAEANREVLIVALIESDAAVRSIDSILDAGIEVAFVGRGDLSASLGVAGQKEHPAVLDAMETVFGAVRARGGESYAGTTPYRSVRHRGWETHDCQFLVHGADCNVLLNGFQSILTDVADVARKNHIGQIEGQSAPEKQPN